MVIITILLKKSSCKPPGAAVPSIAVSLRHRKAAQAGDSGAEQSRSVSSPTGARLETLLALTVPGPTTSVFHLSPRRALQHR